MPAGGRPPTIASTRRAREMFVQQTLTLTSRRQAERECWAASLATALTKASL